jgi:outer membrane protein assembly factor BamB/tetratricopeptide (TPR) repeat protein
MRRTWGLVVAVIFLAALVFVASDDVQGQVKGGAKKAATPGANPPGQPAVVDLADKGRLTLPTEPKLKRKLEAVADYIKSEDWETVAKNVQELLDLDKDVFVQKPEKGPDGKEVETLVGIRIAANRLVASLAHLPAGKPGAALDVYKAVHGANAKALLNQATQEGDKQKFADVAQRYLYTDAGGDAAERLATILLDRGDFMAAAQAFDRLIQRDGLEKLEPLTLFKAAVAFHKGNTKEDRDNKDRVWKQLQAKAPDGFTAGGQTVSLDDAARYLDRIRGGVNTSIHDWPMVGGNPSRSGQGVGDTAFMQALWRHSLFVDSKQAQDLISNDTSGVVKHLEMKGEAVIPAAAPVTATITDFDGRQKSVLVFRNYEGIQARELKTGGQRWKIPFPASLEKLLGGATVGTVNTWVAQFTQANKSGVLIENSTVGTMSSDGGRVYCIDDLAVPPHVQQNFDRWGGMPPPGVGGLPAAVNAFAQGNRLNAVAIASGKLLWSLPPSRNEGEDHFVPKNDFRDSYFLGAPLALGGKLYFLNEKNQEIRLVCLDTGKLPEKVVLDKDVDDAILWVQPLGTAKEKILADYGRRTNAAHIAYGEGILVCPTNAGVLLGVDLLTHSLLWAHTYSNAPPQDPNAGMDPRLGRLRGGGIAAQHGQPGQTPIQSDWKASAPIITDGRVVFTAPDGPELQCLNLRNGTEIWKMKRADEDLYLAGVYSGRVLIVGKKDVRALRLDDGKEVWRVPTGLPSGRGVASDNIYYLPLKDANFSDKEKGPGIFAIDIEHGKVRAQTRSRKHLDSNAVEVPGNLLFFDGEVISMTATELVAYPQLKVKLDMMNELLAKNPNDPKGLFERGELRLDKGTELAGAVEDLHAALKNNPPDDLKPKAQAKLFDAMTELLERDFSNGEKYLDEYRKLCVVAPARPEDAEEARKETQRRQADFVYLVAKGREGQGKLGEALAGYLEYGSLPAAQDELLKPVVDSPVKARADVRARGLIKAMMERATEDQRKPLEDVILGKWAEVKGSGDVEKLRHFVAMFGETAAIGKEGRLYLAERLMEREGKADMLDAETQFLTVVNDDDPSFVVRALEGLARLNTRKGLLEDAYEYYRRLKVRFPDVPVRDGKTGAQLYDELATDRRFLMYMDDVGEAQGRQKFKVDEERDKNFPQQAQHMLYTFDPLDDPLPFLKHRRVAVNYGNSRLMVLDRRATGPKDKPELDEQLKENFQQFMAMQAMNPNMPPGVMVVGMPGMPGNPNAQTTARFGYHAVGHLVVVNLGQYIAAIDTVTHRLLWDKNLFGAQSPVSGAGPHLQYNPTEETLQLWFPDNTFMTIGQGGPVTATYVCVQTRDGLSALDPLTGKTLWTRNDVPTRCRLFGDDRHIFLVEIDNTGSATNTRAFRAQDGASVDVPPFAPLFQKRQRILGGQLLVADTLAAGGVDLRLYDVPSGKDLWREHFGNGTVMLSSEDPELAGAIESDGRLTVVNVRQRKIVFRARVATEYLKNLHQAHLLADGQNIYLALHASNPANPPQIWPNLQPNTGLHGITVNGMVYAFNRRTGKINWFNQVENQQLVLEQWKEMPVLLFTARFNVVNNGMAMRGFVNGNQMGTIGVEAYDKTTGKLVYRQPTTDKPQLNSQSGPIYAVNNDAQAGKIEMISQNYKIMISRQGEATAAGSAASPTGAKPTAGAADGGVDRAVDRDAPKAPPPPVIKK